MIITIDGPVATGKSTIAQRLSKEIGFIYYETGAMYRCLTYALHESEVDPENESKLEQFLEQFLFDLRILHGERRYYVNGEDVTEKIRHREITDKVSYVSALQAVRTKLVDLQRHLGKGVNAVFEGRDMGTVVFPQAELKIFLTGRDDIRALRRYQEWIERFPEDAKTLTLEQVKSDLQRRDLYDSTREHSPLKCAEDAYIIDTSDLTIDEVIERIIEIKNTMKKKP